MITKKLVFPALQLLIATALSLNISACAASAKGQSVTTSPASFTSRQGLLPYEQNTVNIVRKYGNSVVAINVTVRGKPINPYANNNQQQQLPPQYKWFFKQFGLPIPPQSGGSSQPPQQQTERAAGSGFVADSEHQILTNFHVVSDALKGNTTKLKDNASITVTFPGGNPLPVKVVGVNQSYDLALLQLKQPGKSPRNAIPIPLADSNRVHVGEKAIAIGNPFTLQSTVTMGIVSAVNRDQAALVSGVPIPYIQTDAAINPGNSGGPLINSRGQVIGINDEIIASDGASAGVGFAIPSNLIRESFPHLKAGGFYKKAMMGVEVVSLANYPDVVRKDLHLPDHGLMIVKVLPGSPADKVGLKGAQMSVSDEGAQWAIGGDIILEANGEKIIHARTLQKIVFSKHVGSTITLVILRDGHRKTVKVTLEELKGND